VDRAAIAEVEQPEYFTDVTVPEVVKTDEDKEKWTALLPKLDSDGEPLPTLIVRVERNGRSTLLQPNKPFEFQVGDVIRRRLQNGDPVVVERQPVLHKGSFMAFKAKIMPAGSGNVFQIHPVITTPFGADFDGDEMNMYVPQSVASRADVMKKMTLAHCIRSDQNSGALIGLIQNAVLAASNLCRDDIVVSKLLIYDMFKAAQFDRRNPDDNFWTDPVNLMRKAEQLGLVPVSGRVVFSLFLPKGFFYQRKPDVVISDGILLNGILKKRDLGNTSNGIVDALLDQFGPQTTITFLSAVQRALGIWIERTGFTLGPEDCMLNKIGKREEGEETIDTLLAKAKEDIMNVLEHEEDLSDIERSMQESKVRTIITLTQDRIAKIVKAGGTDIAKVRTQIAAEATNKALLEAIQFVLTHIEAPDFQKRLTSFITTTKAGKKKGIKEYGEEQVLLEQVIELLASDEIENAKFKNSKIFGTRGDILRRQYIAEINSSVKLRMQIFGASTYDDNFLRIVLTGAKGTEMNFSHVKGTLGQQLINDERPQVALTDKTRNLPFVGRKSKDPETRGFCSSSFRKGLSVIEFFGHAKATRNNMVEANLKPSDTGYFYRRLALVLENLRTTPSGSVVDANGRMVQTFYGGDGFDARMLMNLEEETGGGRRAKTLVPQFVNVETLVKTIRLRAGKQI
ncbi:MAG: hypothetical protein ACMG6E_05600, partial [Candidatus Roizmanbacteria bacterium]